MKICVVKKHQGGAVGAPVGGQVLSEVLPYLELQKDNVTEEDVRGKQIVKRSRIRNANWKFARRTG